VHFQSSYYYIGHFARFVTPGARRILCSTTRDHLEATAFINPEGSIAVIVMNRTENECSFTLEYGNSAVMCVIPGRSISTYLVASVAEE